jgi:TRAP-type C4-dicarboxylate transport system substrate-binding protein
MRGTIRMQRRALRGGLAAAALGVAGLRIWDLRAQERVVIRATATGDLHGRTGAAIERLAGALAGVSQGRVTLAAEPDAADTAAVIERLRGGEVLLGWVRLAELGDLVPEIAALSVPFLFRDPLRALAILDAASLGPLLNDQVRKRGLEPLGYLDAGALRLAGTAPLSLTALAGQRITARPGALRTVAFKALGLELVPGVPAAGGAGAAPLAELRTDDLAAAGGKQGGPRAVAQAPHAHDLVLVCVNRERFESQDPDVRELLRAQVREVATWQRGGTAQVDAAVLQTLRQQGAAVAPLPEEDTRQAHDRVKAAVAAALSGAEPSIVRTVLAYAD